MKMKMIPSVDFLFHKEDIESKKELLCRRWQKRKAEMKKCDLAGNP